MDDNTLAKKLFDMLISVKIYVKNHISLPNNSPLTEAQFKTLVTLNKFNKISLKDLSEELNVSSSSLSIMLNKLAADGWVLRTYDNVDRRLTYFILSPRGEKYIDNAIDSKVSEITSTIVSLTVDEKQDLNNALVTVERIIAKMSSR